MDQSELEKAERRYVREEKKRREKRMEFLSTFDHDSFEEDVIITDVYVGGVKMDDSVNSVIRKVRAVIEENYNLTHSHQIGKKWTIVDETEEGYVVGATVIVRQPEIVKVEFEDEETTVLERREELSDVVVREWIHG